jgi:hypothetical protein
MKKIFLKIISAKDIPAEVRMDFIVKKITFTKKGYEILLFSSSFIYAGYSMQTKSLVG